MNCVLQCLSNTRPLLELSLNSDLLKEINTDTSRLKGSLATGMLMMAMMMMIVMMMVVDDDDDGGGDDDDG